MRLEPLAWQFCGTYQNVVDKEVNFDVRVPNILAQFDSFRARVCQKWAPEFPASCCQTHNTTRYPQALVFDSMKAIG